MGIHAAFNFTMAQVAVYPSPGVRGAFHTVGGEMISRLSLPTDPQGSTSVTFSGIVAGSEVHVYLPDGTEVAGVESCIADQILTWPVYAPGSPNNTVTITLIKRGLRWQKFPYQSETGSQVLPIFQNPDLGYNNPA